MAFQSGLVPGDGSLKLGFRRTRKNEDSVRVALTAVRIRAGVLKWHLGLDPAMQVHGSAPSGIYTPWLYRQDDKDITMNVVPATVVSNGVSGMYMF